MSKWHKATCEGGKTRRAWKVRDDSVVAEVKRREPEGSNLSEDRVVQDSALVAVARETGVCRFSCCGIGKGGVRRCSAGCYTVSYADDTLRIYQMLDTE